MPNENHTSTIKNKLNVALGLFAGGAIGAAVGVLFSPHSGTVLRRIIRRKGAAIADEVTEKVEERIGYISNTVTPKIDAVGDELKSRFGSVRDTFINR